MLKNKKVILISSIVLILTITASLIFFLNRSKESTKDLYFRIETENFVKYMNELGKKRNDYEKKYKLFKENPSRSRYEISAKLSSPDNTNNSFGSIPSQAVDVINSSKIVLNSRYNIKEEKNFVSLAFLLEGLNFADANIFIDKNVLGLQIPVIYEKYFLLDKDNPETGLKKLNLDLPIRKILLPGDIRPYTDYSIDELKDILVEYLTFLKDNISDDQIVLVRNIQEHGFEAPNSGKYDQYTILFDENQLKNIYSTFIKMAFEDKRLISATIDKLKSIADLLEETGYFDLFSDARPLIDSLLNYSDYENLEKYLLNTIEDTRFPDGLNMKIIVDSSRNIISRSISISTEEGDVPRRNYDIVFSPDIIDGKIVQAAESDDNEAEILFTFKKNDSKSNESESIDAYVKCTNNIWPDFEAYIIFASEVSENAKRKSINTNYKISINLTMEEYMINKGDILIDIKREDRYDESFDIPEINAQTAVDLNNISDEEFAEVIKELQFSVARFLLNNKDLIEPFTDIN